MKNYPNLDEADKKKSEELHVKYRRKWLTRPGAGGVK
jgi:hypothetical protein